MRPASFFAALVVLAIRPVAAEAAPDHYTSPGKIHKVQIDNLEMARETLSRGSKAIADYGSYQLIEVDQREFERLMKLKPSAIPRDEYNLVEFIGGRIDSSVELPEPPVRGRSLHVIQFRGPIRSEWLQAVEAAGSRIVCGISYNAYLIIGTESALLTVTKSPGVQWSAPFLASYKIDPRLNLGLLTKTPLVEIQLVEDVEWNAPTLALLESLSTSEVHVSRALGYVNVIGTVSASNVGSVASRPDVISIQLYATPKRQ